MQVYRIADSRHPIWDGTGAAMVGGRWNSPGRPVIYASLSYACAMLEILVCANIGRIPAVQACVVAEAPENLAVERHGAQSLPVGWDGDDPATAQRFGDLWLQEVRCAVLVIPSVVARLECNALINPLHADANRLQVLPSQEVIWGQRLFAQLGV